MCVTALTNDSHRLQSILESNTRCASAAEASEWLDRGYFVEQLMRIIIGLNRSSGGRLPWGGFVFIHHT